MLDLNEFKKAISRQFGENLENATPENVRHFLDQVPDNAFSTKTKGRILLDEPSNSFEEVLKDFFTRVLDLPRDEALIMLWLLAFDLAFSAIELQQAEKFKSLFGEFER